MSSCYGSATDVYNKMVFILFVAKNLIVQIQFHTAHTLIQNCRFHNMANKNKFVIYYVFLQYLISIN